MSSIKFLLNSSTQYCLLNGNSMKYRQVPILIRLPSPVLRLNKVVPLLILVALRKLLLVRKNKTSPSLIFTFRSFSTPSLLSIWISSFTTPLLTSSKILIQLYIMSCFFRFSSHSLYFTSLKVSWSILEVSLFEDTINSLIVLSLKTSKFWRTFSSLKLFENW